MKNCKHDNSSRIARLSRETVGLCHALFQGVGAGEEFDDDFDQWFLSIREAAECLSVEPSWVRTHLAEFPNRITKVRSIRIPGADIKAALERWRKSGVEQLTSGQNQ